jgi:hypothetical protein
MMYMKLVRDQVTAGCTLGRLFVDGAFECFTCEDVERPDGDKVHGQTAIPRGRYGVIVTRSPRFGRDLPLLVNVPNFVGVRIHPGNTAADTEGCILPGRHRTASSVTESRLAFAGLFEKIRSALDAGEEVQLEVTGE